MNDALFQQSPGNIYFVRLLKTNILLGKRQAIVLPLTNWGEVTEYSIFITFQLHFTKMTHVIFHPDKVF